MAGKMLGNHPSEYGITMNGSQMTSNGTVNDLQTSMSRWYFSRKEIEDLSPSRKDGIAYKKETELRMLYCSFLQDLGIKLKVPQVTIAAAMLLCHRFYLRQSHAKNEWQTMATVSMFLACKVEETPRLLMDVIVVAYEIMYRKNPAAAQRIKQKDIYEKQKELVLLGERLLLATIGFDFNIPLPYKPLVAALKRMKISHNDIAKVAWNFLNDWLRTTLCLQYKPHYLAAGSMYLAAKFNKVKLPSEKGNVWWLEFDVVPQKLEEVIQQMLGLLEENKRPANPLPHEKNAQPTVSVNKEQPRSSQSCVLSSSVITSNSKDGICREDEGGSRSAVSKNGSLHESQRGPCKDISAVRKEVLQCQTSDSGSSHSVVEDGEDRTNEGEVQGTVIKSNPTPDSSRDSSYEGEAQVKVIQELNLVVVSAKIVSGSVGLSKIDKDRIREAIKKRKLEDGTDRTNEGEVQGTIVKSNQIPDSSRDRSHEGEAQATVIQPNENFVSGSGGLSKIDKDRIREAIKKRKSESISSKKVVKKSTDNDLDDDSWIVRELENGLEMDASAEKRQRL